MNERIIGYLWYALEVFMEIGLGLLVCVFVIAVIVAGFRTKELQCFFTDDTLVTPWEKEEKKARRKAERAARKARRARRAQKW